jgi:hypothetical protein
LSLGAGQEERGWRLKCQEQEREIVSSIGWNELDLEMLAGIQLFSAL